jgi:hypothetical protein
MKEEWLFSGAMVPVDVETTAALVAEIKRLINVVGGMALSVSGPVGGAPIRAHSKTEYKRLVTQCANVLPPGIELTPAVEYKFVFKITNEKAKMEISGAISASAKDAILTILTTADPDLLGASISEEEIKKLQSLRKLVEEKNT